MTAAFLNGTAFTVTDSAGDAFYVESRAPSRGAVDVVAWAATNASSITVTVTGGSGARAATLATYGGWSTTPALGGTGAMSTGSGSCAVDVADNASASGVWAGGVAWSGPATDVLGTTSSGVVTASGSIVAGTSGASAGSNVTSQQVYALNVPAGPGSLAATNASGRACAGLGASYSEP